MATRKEPSAPRPHSRARSGHSAAPAAPRSTRKSAGYWRDFANLERELRAFIASRAGMDPGTLPTRAELTAAGRLDLFGAISVHGGFSAVARRLGLRPARHRQRYLHDFAGLERELRAFIAGRQATASGVLPDRDQFARAGRRDLAAAIARHGGFSAVARRLGLRPARQAPGYWSVFAHLERDLRAFIASREDAGHDGMPTHAQLAAAGRMDLIGAIIRHGGFGAVARRLGLRPTRRAAGYWRSLTNLERELRAFITSEDGVDPEALPARKQLIAAGRQDLARAIKWHGGFAQVARRLRLKPPPMSRAPT